MPPSQGRRTRGLEHRFSCKASVYQLGYGCYRPSTRHTHELVHMCLADRGVPSAKGGKKKPPLPAQSANRLCGLGGPALAQCSLRGKTHAALLLGVNQVRHRPEAEFKYTKAVVNIYNIIYIISFLFFKSIYMYIFPLSSRVNNIFLVYSGTFHSLQDQHEKPQPHLYTSPCSV